MTNAAFVQRLLAIKVQVDTLLGDAAALEPATESTPTVTTPAPDPDLWAAAQSDCKHPTSRRTDMRGFGSAGHVKRFHCDACGQVITEGW